MEMVLIKQDSNEWNYMWEWLENHPLNEGITDPSLALHEKSGELWEYMGSYRQNAKVIHEFRHRCHPKSERVEYLKTYASENITDEDIEKVVKMK